MSSSLYDSHKFSEDISREMRIPERIGAQGALDSSSKGFAVGADYPGFSRVVVDMSIPDRILATGEAGDANTPTYDPLDPSMQVRPSDVISVESLPETITLDRLRYPDIQPDQPDADKPRRRRNPGGSDASDSGAVAVGSTIPAAPAGSSGNLTMAVLRLQKRLEALEAENEQRRRRELVLYPAIGLYFLFKIVGWFMRPRRLVGGGQF